MRKFFTRSRTVRRLRFFAFLFILVSLLNRVDPHSTWMWQASIVTKEFGYVFALFGAWMVVRLWWFRRRVWAMATTVGVLLFVGPVWDAVSLEGIWQTELKTGLRTSDPVPDLISMGTLFFGRSEEPVGHRRMEYKTVDSRPMALDFYPSSRTEGPSPWVVVLHGGGWQRGGPRQLPELNSILARNGYAVASISYRFAPEYKWPAQKEDLADAITFLKSRAGELGLDSDRFFILGRSAGAQIGGVYAYTSKEPGLRGFISYYAPLDLRFGYWVGEEDDLLQSRRLLRQFLGGQPDESPWVYDDSSVNVAAKLAPVPTLLLHGRADPLALSKHSEIVLGVLRQKDIPSAYVEFWSATHGFDWHINGPSGQVATNSVLYFLDQFSKKE